MDKANTKETFGFSNALLALKAGAKVARRGWNAKNQWVNAQFPDENSKMQCPYLYLKNAQDKLVPWVPSTGDLFAEDWEILEDSDDGFCSVFQVIRPDGTNSSYHPKTKLESDTLKKLTQRERWDLLEKWRKESSLDSFIRRTGK